MAGHLNLSMLCITFTSEMTKLFPPLEQFSKIIIPLGSFQHTKDYEPQNSSTLRESHYISRGLKVCKIRVGTTFPITRVSTHQEGQYQGVNSGLANFIMNLKRLN